MVQILDIGTSGIVDFEIRRGVGEPTANFDVNYSPCNGLEDTNIRSGAIINLYLSDPKETNGYEDIFKGMIDNVNEVENNEGFSYQISGRDLAAVLSYQKYTLYGELSIPNSKRTGSVLNSIPSGNKTHGNIVSVWGEINNIVKYTPITNIKTNLPVGGETCFSATEWWSYRTDAAETVNDVEYEQGEWHSNRKQRIVVTPTEMTKAEALDTLLHDAMGIGSHLGRYEWCVDKNGVLIIFNIDKPQFVTDINISMDCISEISIGDDSSGVTNAIKGYGHNKTVKTTEPAKTTRIESCIKDQESIDWYGQRDAPDVDNQDLSQDELDLTCRNSINPDPKNHISVIFNNYSNISPATALRIPNRPRAGGKVFTVTDYLIKGTQGDYQTIAEGEIIDQIVAKPSPFQTMRAIARNEVNKLYAIHTTLLDVDSKAGLVLAAQNNAGNNPQWVRYPRKTG